MMETLYINLDQKILRKWYVLQWRENSLLVGWTENGFINGGALKLGIDKWGRFAFALWKNVNRGTSMR